MAVATAPESWGSGLGAEVLRLVCEECRRRKVAAERGEEGGEVRVVATTVKGKMARWYEKRGFKSRGAEGDGLRFVDLVWQG